jgi:hypothetical protein
MQRLTRTAVVQHDEHSVTDFPEQTGGQGVNELAYTKLYEMASTRDVLAKTLCLLLPQRPSNLFIVASSERFRSTLFWPVLCHALECLFSQVWLRQNPTLCCALS